MSLFALILGLAGGAGLGLVAALAVARVLRRHADDDREAAVAAAVERLGAERDAAIAAAVDAVAAQAAERFGAHTQATVETVLTVAGDKLGAHAQAATRELDVRNDTIEAQISGMNDELRQVRTLVADLQKQKAEQHGQFITGLENAVRASETLQTTTQSLREALSNSRARGQWGERMAEDVLRAAGFVEGVNYRRQKSVDGGRPDLTFLLPRNRLLHMDVKFPIDNYLRFLEATSDVEKEAFRKAFLRDVRARVKEITTRDYISPLTTVGYVLLFIPNEAVCSFIHEHDQALLDDSLRQRVVLCSPVTLFAVLAVVRQAVDNFMLERTSDEILVCLSVFTKQWEAFADKLDKLGTQLNTVQKTYDDVMTTRRRALEREIDRVASLRRSRDASAAAAGPPSDDVLAPFGAVVDNADRGDLARAADADTDTDTATVALAGVADLLARTDRMDRTALDAAGATTELDDLAQVDDPHVGQHPPVAVGGGRVPRIRPLHRR